MTAPLRSATAILLALLGGGVLLVDLLVGVAAGVTGHWAVACLTVAPLVAVGGLVEMAAWRVWRSEGGWAVDGKKMENRHASGDQYHGNGGRDGEISAANAGRGRGGVRSSGGDGSRGLQAGVRQRVQHGDDRGRDRLGAPLGDRAARVVRDAPMVMPKPGATRGAVGADVRMDYRAGNSRDSGRSGDAASWGSWWDPGAPVQAAPQPSGPAPAAPLDPSSPPSPPVAAWPDPATVPAFIAPRAPRYCSGCGSAVGSGACSCPPRSCDPFHPVPTPPTAIDPTVVSDACGALVRLGFRARASRAAVSAALLSSPLDATLEDVIRLALRSLR